jgi:hypothetical protein
MASLTGTKIKNTYDSLLKTTDNEPLDGTLRTITDGLGNNSTLSLSTSAASVGGTLSVSGNATFDTNVYVGGVVANVDDLDTNISFGTNQISLITGGLTRLSASDASTQVTNPLIASSTLTVTGNYNSIFGDIALANGKIAVGGSVSIANSVGASLFSPNANLLVLGDTGAAANQGMTIVSPTGATGNIYFADGTTGDAEYRGSITYNHNVDTLYIGAAATNKLAISGTQSTFSGNVLVVGNLPSYTNSLYVDSTTNNVGIGTNNPQNSSGYAGLHLNGATGGVVKFMDDATVVSQVFGNNNEVTIQAEGERDVVVKTNNSERLRIEDAGASVTGTLAVSGAATFSGALNGTLSTAAQTNITSVGTLTSLAVSGNLTMSSGSDLAAFLTSPDANAAGIYFPRGGNNYYSGFERTGTNLRFLSGGAGEVMRIDSSGNVGIGTSSPSYKLTVSQATNGFYPLRLIGGDSLQSEMGFYLANGGGSLGLNTSGDLSIFTNGADRMRIDSSGNVGIGVSPTTKLTIDNSSISATNHIDMVGNSSLAKGHIGYFSNGVYIASNYFFNGSQNNDDATLGQASMVIGAESGGGSFSFGTSAAGSTSTTQRVRIDNDGLKFNGDTSAANALDDYEEGTFTPTASGASSAGTTSYSNQYGYYTKIGRQVNVTLVVSWTAMTGTGTLRVGGLPFTIATLTNGYPIGTCLPSGLNWSSGTYLQSVGITGESFMHIVNLADDTDEANQQCVNESASIRVTLTYFV